MYKDSKLSGSSQLCVETDTATTSWRLISEAQTPETPTAPTEYLAIPCELKADTGLGDPDRLAVAGRSGDAPKRPREGKHVIAEVVSQHGEARRRPTMASARGLQRGAGAAIMLFPPFPLPSAFCIHPSPSSSRSANTSGTERSESERANRGEVKWMDGWWIHHGVGGLWHKAPAAFLSDDGGGASKRRPERSKEERPPSEPLRPSRRAKQGSHANRELRHCSGSFPLAAFRHLMLPSQGPLEMTMGPRAVDVGWTRWRPEVAVEPGLHKS
ncbi:hypothetical protein CFAM422_011464 [Trichoderma lentiforme]|uniref:Uncharacterized protein n=1 Tax=Trichoderma lentiforme TaxID=1567552 RepID=A0A9P4X497_9HYPO|nr:hypothetical protein CFAM422_011464 [Trichoderma lentiforme]